MAHSRIAKTPAERAAIAEMQTAVDAYSGARRGGAAGA